MQMNEQEPTVDVQVNLPCTKHTDGAKSCRELAQEALAVDGTITPPEEFCDSCRAVALLRYFAAQLQAIREQPGPLLQCTTCHNTESPAGAMARYFNKGRCLHCGGWFMVVRA
jgi:hypothetical protein